MSDARPVVWVVASERAVSRWAPAFEARDLAAHPLAWSEVQPLDPDDVDLESALRSARDELVILTSANAVAFVPDALCAGLRAACVGEGTARAARAKGFEVLHVGRAGGEGLAIEMLAAMPDLEWVHYLHQRDVRPEGAETLAQAGLTVRLTGTYAIAERGNFPARVAAAPEPAAVVLGSPRAADALDRAGRALPEGAFLAALGPTTVARARELFGARVVEAAETTPEALAEAVCAQLATLGEGEER